MPTSLPASLVSEIDARVSARMEKGHWPGLAVGIQYRGQTTVRAYGFANLEHHVPVCAETVFRVGSITKPFTASLILRLQEMGRLSVEDEVVRHLPDFPTQGHAITIHHLLTHTSGLEHYTRHPDFWPRSREDLSHTEVRALFEDLPLRFEPGTDHEYCNSGYYLLGLIAEQVTGSTYPDAINEYIFQPLGLGNTSYVSTSRITLNRASGYDWDGRSHKNAAYFSVLLPGGGGGLGSTVGDLLKWQRSLSDGAFLSAESLAAMRSPTALSTGEEVPYGYGMGIFEFEGEPKLKHSGGVNGFASILTLYPTRDLGIAVSANIHTGSWAIESEIARLVLALPVPNPTVIALSNEQLEAIAGTYTNGFERIPASVQAGGISWLGEHYLPIDDSTFVAVGDLESRMTFDAREVDSPRLTSRVQLPPPALDGRPQVLRITRDGVNHVYPRSTEET